MPFAGLARAGFIAVQLLQSLVEVKVLDEQDYTQFLASLETVSTQMVQDLHKLPSSNFLNKYGHLRPGTYDILSTRYDQTPELYFNFDNIRARNSPETNNSFTLSLPKLSIIQQLAEKHGLEYNALSLLNFIKEAIEAREFGKFVFTKSLSEVLEIISHYSRECGYTLENISYADITAIKKLYSTSEEPKKVLEMSILKGKHHYDITKQIVLPPLITSPNEVYAFNFPPTEPNFVTLKSFTGSILLEKDFSNSRIQGNIVFIQNADPGFDWLFSAGVDCFVTKFGGANSHMAIRAAELGIPAVLGAGEALFQQWQAGKLLSVDCCNKQVKILQ